MPQKAAMLYSDARSKPLLGHSIATLPVHE